MVSSDGLDRFGNFVCGYRLIWAFLLVFSLVMLSLSAIAYPTLEPGTASYVIMQVNVVALVSLLLVVLYVHVKCGYAIGPRRS